MSTHAARQFRKLPRSVAQRLKPAIIGLGNDPRPEGALKLSGTRDAWRVRVGDYRIIYEIHVKVLVVLVIDLGHRKDVYR